MATMTEGDAGFLDTAPIKIVNELELTQDPEAVWAVLVDTEGWPDWFGSCKQARTTSEQREGVGSTRWVQVDLFKVSERIIAWDQPERWGFTLYEANLPIAKTVVEIVTLRPEGSGTHMTYTFGIELKPWMKPFSKLFEWNMSRLFRTSLAGLQPHLDRLEAERRADA